MYELVRGVAARHDVLTLSLYGPGDDLSAAERVIGRVVGVPVPLTARMPPGPSKRLTQARSILSRRSFQDRLYRHPAAQQAIDRLVRSEQPDNVQIEFSQMGGYVVPPGPVTVLDVHNVEHDVLAQIAATGSLPRRAFNRIEARKVRNEEGAAWRRASCCLATSADDVARIEEATGRSAVVIPNGVDLEYFRRSPLDVADPDLLVFVGAMRYQPNALAARYVVEQILPLVRAARPQTRLALVGADPPEAVTELAEVPGVEVTGTVADVRPWLNRAAVVVVPLLSGGGTRLKILEAFAAGRPVVSTTLGASGIAARHGEHLLLADTAETFSQSIIMLLRDRAEAHRLVVQAHALASERYGWPAIVEQLADLYRCLLDRSSQRER
jgi:glycosyltransferase involved in cell wall biosynthesis